MSNEKEFPHNEKNRKNDKEVRKYVSALGKDYLLPLWCVKKRRRKKEKKKKDNHRQIKG